MTAKTRPVAMNYEKTGCRWLKTHAKLPVDCVIFYH